MVYNLKRLQNKTSLLVYPISTNLKHVVDLVRGYFKDIVIIKNNRKGALGLDNFPKLEKTLQDKNNVIVFTSLVDYNLINSVFKIKHTCIILESWGYDTCQFVEAKGIKCLYYLSEFCSKLVSLEVVKTRPDHLTMETLQSVDEPEVKRLLCTYVYPDINEEQEDKPAAFGGWITPNTRASPKIANILHGLRDHRYNIVLCQFDDKYGTHLIKSLLYNHGVTCTGDIHVFNESEEQGILVTNEYEFDHISHVDAIHIVDDYDIGHLCKIIRKSTSHNCDPLHIYLYPLMDTIDARDAGCVIDKLNSMVVSYELLVDHAKHI